MRFGILIGAPLLFACAVDPTLETTSQDARIHNRLGANRLGANRLGANRLGANRLGANRLGANRLTLNPIGAADLLSTDDGRNVLSYIVSCAVPETETLVGTHGTCSADSDCGTIEPGTCTAGTCSYSFPGLLGLAPAWLDEQLDSTGKGWVSACMFARVNAHDTAEEISLRGAHRSLTVSPDEATLYSVEEGAFYGNLFTPLDQPIDWNACQGAGQAAGESGGLVLRDCAEPDPTNPNLTQCGFKFAGDCADFTPDTPSSYACRALVTADSSDDGDDDHDCGGHGHHHGHHDNGHHWGWSHHSHSNHHGHGGDDDDDATATAGDHGMFYVDCHAQAGPAGWRHSHEYQQVITTYVTP
jgi:hypothetical protein